MLALPHGMGLDDWIVQQQFPDRDALLHTMLEHVTNVAIPPAPSTDPPFDVDASPWATTKMADSRHLLEYTPEHLLVVRTAGIGGYT